MRFSEHLEQVEKREVNFKSHSGRIGFITFCRRSGFDFDSIAEMVGHYSTETTKKYSKVTQSKESIRTSHPLNTNPYL